jgi:hypothetical protein
MVCPAVSPDTVKPIKPEGKATPAGGAGETLLTATVENPLNVPLDGTTEITGSQSEPYSVEVVVEVTVLVAVWVAVLLPVLVVVPVTVERTGNVE